MQKSNKSKGSKTLNVMTFNMAQPSLIEASAGTGKTYTITNLVLRALLGIGHKENCLERPLEIDELLIATFTNAAASDLRTRIYNRIREARSCIEEFVNFVIDYLNSNSDFTQDGVVKNHNKIKEKLLVRVKDKEGKEIGPVSYKDYSDQQMHDLMLEINIEAAFEKIGVKDQVFLEIIKEILDRNIVPLRQAALILVRAERKINQASISTIHSFCNSILTRIYALEAGEAFNTELKSDLSDIENEAYNQVWRRLFYQENSSQYLLDQLNCSSPQSLIYLIQDLNKVRLTSCKKGFYGFEIYEFDKYLEDNHCHIDITKELEPQIFAYLKTLEDHKANIVSGALSFYQEYNEQSLAELYNHNTNELSDIFIVNNKTLSKLNSSGKELFNDLYNFLIALRELQNTNQDELKSLYEVNKGQALSLGSIVYLNKDKFTEDYCLNKRYKEKAKFNELIAKFHICWQQHLESCTKDFEIIKNSADILKILVAILMIQESESKFKELNVMSNDDVLRRLDYALNERNNINDDLAKSIRARYPLAMIDEFQDTDPVQFNIFSKIYLNQDAIDSNAFCYLIGDPKQSIYAFRGSDINSYLKAKNLIVELTKGQGIYTLDTNYRSSVDVVEATNAIFGTTLNPKNYNPFNESDIPFNPVLSGKGKQLEAKLKKQKTSSSLDRDFILNGLDQYIESDEQTDEPLGKLKFNSKANTYLVTVGSFNSKKDLEKAYAQSTAFLVKQILDQGFIIKDGVKHRVNSGDIAIIVSTGSQNNLIQDALWEQQIPSVYFSDSSSVLTEKQTDSFGEQLSVSKEAEEIRYLMEAMCDCTNLKKVNRLLGCRMLALDSEDFIKFTSAQGIEKEVQILLNCARTWEEYGFLPAFLQWASDPYHNMEARLLELKSGERAYTNYCHISEIVQRVHVKKMGNQTQMHWYNNLINNSLDDNDLDQDQVKKRLESEQDQVKILTIHKSKGLEFPIVISPFLWEFAKKDNIANLNKPIKSVRYYAQDPYEHYVMDLDPERKVLVNELLPTVDIQGNLIGKNINIAHIETAKNIYKNSTTKENTRLLYVALTRARYANFLLFGTQKSGRQGKEYGSSLVNMHLNHELQNVVDHNNEVKKFLPVELICPDQFILEAKKHPELFTIINLSSLINQEESEKSLSYSTKDFAPLPFTINDESLGSYDRRSLNVSSLPEDKPLPTFAQSFLYDKAIDKSFNIISYSSLTAESKSNSLLTSLDAQDYDLMDMASHDDSLFIMELNDEDNSLEKNDINSCKELANIPLFAFINEKAQANLLKKESGDINKELIAPNCSWSYLAQSNWQSNFYYNNDSELYPMEDSSEKICYSFPRGANAGTCMHNILEHIKFEKLKDQGFKSYIQDTVINEVVDNPRYSSLIRSISNDRQYNKKKLSEWFNDVLEAPIIAGKYHCFALADLKESSYEPEMRFLMSNERFKTEQLDVICRKVAKSILPASYQEYVESLTLSEDELVGYITGSIDLACRFDLNESLQLRERSDLQKLLSKQSAHELALSISKLKSHRLAKNSNLSKYDPELFANASFEKVAAMRKEQDGSNVKYYVIDYKSNYLGPDNNSYDDKHMLSAIYAHRYDVQFMIYSLALYRHLKRRFAIPFDAPKEELKVFYDDYVGGAIYLFLRGMKANYNRDYVSNGVFAIKLDFDIVYELDMLFSIGDVDN